MNPLLAALVQLGILTQQDADRMGRQLNPAMQRQYAEATLAEALQRSLSAQQRRLLDTIGRANGRPTARQMSLFWERENGAMWDDLRPTFEGLATEIAVTASIRAGTDTWSLVNENVISWVNDYYTNAELTAVGSIPNLNLTARSQFASAFLDWQRGELETAGYANGLPQLVRALEPVFGAQRAKVIATTETTRVMASASVESARSDEFVEYLEAFSAQDELVCPTCGPVSGQVIPKNSSGFVHPEEGNIGFPPYHVNCRCWCEGTTQNVVDATGGSVTNG